MKNPAKYYVVTISKVAHSIEEAGKFLDQEGADTGLRIVKGDQVDIVKVYSEVNSKTRKPRTAKAAALPPVPKMKRGGRPKGSKNKPKVANGFGQPALADGTPVVLP